MGRVGDQIVDEISERCVRLLRNSVMIAHTIYGEPYRELYLGPVTMTHMIDTDFLKVHMEHELYNYTSDLVLAVEKHRHLFSRWPQCTDLLRFLRVHMVLDDLAAA